MNEKRKVIFCTFSSIYSSIVLTQLLSDKSIDVVAIINSTRILNKQNNHILGSLKQIKTSGFRYAYYLFLVTDFFSLIQSIISFKNDGLKSVHSLATLHGIPILNTRDINNAEAIEFIEQKTPDYILSAHFNQLVKEPILSHPTIQCYNIHPSLLPLYKGVDPVFFVLLNQKNQTGVSLHEMSNEFDSGSILMQESLEIDKSESVFSINKKLFSIGTKLSIEAMLQTHKNGLDVQEILNNSYDSWPTKEQSKQFKKQGGKLINMSDFFKTLWKSA